MKLLIELKMDFDIEEKINVDWKKLFRVKEGERGVGLVVCVLDLDWDVWVWDCIVVCCFNLCISGFMFMLLEGWLNGMLRIGRDLYVM